MTVPTKAFLDSIHPYQKELLADFDINRRGIYLTEWARRHRKTTLWLNVLIREACRFKYCSYAHIFPYQVEARMTVWDSPDMLPNYLPDKQEMGWKLDQQAMTIKFANGSLIKVGGADEPDRWRGPEWVGVVFDEAKHIKHEMWTAIIQPVLAGKLSPAKAKAGVKRWAALAYTPEGISWVTEMFDRACMLGEGGTLPDCGTAEMLRDGFFASRLDAELAGIMTPEALAKAKAEMLPSMYDQEMRCARITQEQRTLVTSEMLHTLGKQPERRPGAVFKRIVSIDPAFGGDMCCIMGIEDGKITHKRHAHPTKAAEIVFAAKELCRLICTKNIICDGIGNNIPEMLEEDRDPLTNQPIYNVQCFKSSEQASERPDLYANRRAEAYAYTARQIQLCSVAPISDRELLRQLPVASQYKMVSRGVQILLKDVIKEQLGCSPDDADCYTMGIWGLQFVESEAAKEYQMGRALVGAGEYSSDWNAWEF